MKALIQKYVLVMVLMVVASAAFAQKKTLLATMYHKNKTASVTLKDGRVIKTPNANVFLKNGALIYFQGNTVKEANMDIILGVEFDDKNFINIENRLAYFVDSIKGNALYCVEIIDMDAFERNLKNNVNYTFIDLQSDHLDTFTNDLNTEEDFVFPVNREFFFRLDGKYVQADYRELYRVLNKERFRILKTITNVPDFDWLEPECLMRLLGLISK
ncbi:MAG: hypothetical protein J5548_09785 [Prevotella sp.]|nr:hypothetical protein [Prevotella sp.]